MNLKEYISNLTKHYNSKIATEHSYRGSLEDLIKFLVSNVSVTNEPKRQACGAPDYIIAKNEIPIAYIEAKDIGVNLDVIEKTEQIKRYIQSLDNIILTDYLDFRLFVDGVKVYSVNIAHIENGVLKENSENFVAFENLIRDFCSYTGKTIKSPSKLAKMMADKAKLMQEVIYKALLIDDSKNNSLQSQLEAFRKVLIHDMKEEEFADIYAQTIAYGLFAARLHDETKDNFSRQEAVFLVPKTNPFLRQLFSYIACPDLDERITWIVDALADVFSYCDVSEILASFGDSKGINDPFIHFYETFLSEYNPKLRKSRGVYYTPEPVVNFIVRVVDDILKTDFNLPAGLADTTKTEITVDIQGKKKKELVHKVQILDPATGTGTFLCEVVKHIAKRFEGQEGIWSDYVEKELMPRLNGFELLMAPYVMCHLKLDLLLTQKGYKPKNPDRFKVYLTNSLEEAHPDTGSLFTSWLSNEASEANTIKRDAPVMVVIGNPPYSVSSSNKGEWILDLIKDYKKDLNERKINLDDDYIKFIRYAEYFIEKNRQGVIAMITNNSFIDGITHRQMRKHLLETFDQIYIYDLHGNSKKKEICPDGSKDENVFDIQQGVSINIFVKTSIPKKLADVYHYESFGKREVKYNRLNEENVSEIKWKKLNYKEPYYFFVPKNFEDIKNYEQGFKVNEIFKNYNSGIESGKDNFIIKTNENELSLLKSDLQLLNEKELSEKYEISIDKIQQVLGDLKNASEVVILYRPFDLRHTFLSPNSEGVFWRPRFSIMKHFLKSNLGFIAKRGFNEDGSAPVFITKFIFDRRGWSRPGMQGAESIFPLYLYPDQPKEDLFQNEQISRKPNLNDEIVTQIAEKIKLPFIEDSKLVTEENKGKVFCPEDLLDYIYAVLHSLSYREKYKEFLKIDFPRVPYPDNTENFWKLVEKGRELRAYHLMEHLNLNNFITRYPVGSDNLVEKVFFEGSEIGKVWINSTQYFENVPKISWDFYVGGYQPAQKWLKDRKGRNLSFEDIMHYQKIIIALKETDRIMREIDEIGNL